MVPSEPGNEPSAGLEDGDLAETWKDLQKGERTADMLESHLSTLEKKIDDLLASVEPSELDKAATSRTSDSGDNNVVNGPQIEKETKTQSKS